MNHEHIRLSQDFYEFLRNKIPISEIISQKILLTRRHHEYSGLCPFHHEKTPSFTVNNAKRFFYCFGCGASGDVIKFRAMLNSISYREAAILLAKERSIELPKMSEKQRKQQDEMEEIYNCLDLANDFFRSHLTKEVREYLKTRGINNNIIDEFNIGFATGQGKLQQFFASKSINPNILVKSGLFGVRENSALYEIFHQRITFPIQNSYNKIVAFGARLINNNHPKYLNSPETVLFKKSEVLYAYNKAITQGLKKNYIILTEGYLDILSLHMAGIKESVASLGTAVSEFHLRRLWDMIDEIIICMDSDNAGLHASKRIIDIALPLIKSNKKLSFINLPQGEDPNSLLQRQGGANLFYELLQKRINLSEKIWYVFYDSENYSSHQTAEDKAYLLNKLDSYNAKITDKTLSSSYKKFFQKQIWLAFDKQKFPTKNSFKSDLTSFKVKLPDLTCAFEELNYLVCLLLLKYPELIKREEVRNFFSSLNFVDDQLLLDFRDFLLEDLANILDSGNYIFSEIEENIKNTRFYKSFLLILNEKRKLYSFFSAKNDAYIEWQKLYKQYHLLMLQRDYANYLADINNSDADFDQKHIKRLQLYSQEINNILREINQLNDIIVNLEEKNKYG